MATGPSAPVPAERDITFGDLLTHRAGITYAEFHSGPFADAYAAALGRQIDGEWTPDQWIARLGGLPLIDQPARNFHYGHSTDLLGFLLARIKDAPLSEILARWLLRPLGMTDTAFTVPAQESERCVANHGFDDHGRPSVLEAAPNGHTLAVRPPHFTYVSGGQGLWSTADDFLTFARMFVEGGAVDGVQLLRPDTLDAAGVGRRGRCELRRHLPDRGLLRRPAVVPGTEVVGTTKEGRRSPGSSRTGATRNRCWSGRRRRSTFPDGVEDGEALALLVQGLTAWHLLRTSAVLREGETVLVHAAAGGVGSLAVQLGSWSCRRRGLDRREARARARLGADVAVDPATDDLGGAIEAAVGGPVDVVLDMVGGPTTDASLAVLAPFGHLVHFGQASRTPPSPVYPGALTGGSRTIARFYLGHCFMDPARMIGPPMAELQRLVAVGELRVVVHPPYPLEEARRAHEDMRARLTTGKVVLTI